MQNAAKIGWVTCTSIVVANMVGTGVFTSLGFQVGALPSGFVILLLWAAGAGFALCGAMSYAELAGALPRSGGEYNFLSQIYHPAVGFMAGVVSATVGFAAPVALASMAFGEYTHRVFPAFPPMAASIGVVIFVTGAHLITISSSRRFQNLFTGLKVVLILVLIAAGFFFGPTEPVRFVPTAGDGALILSAPFAVALMYVMYSYSGWNASTYIIGEVRNPGFDVPRSLIAGTLIVGIFYVGLNAIFLKVAPMSELDGVLDVASVAAGSIFGPGGGRLMSALIAVGLVSSISAMTWAGPRVAATVGEDFAALRLFSRRTDGGIPWVATMFQFILVVGLALTATFEDVLIYTQFALLVCGLLTVVGVIVLRVRRPDLERPFRCWGYPATPLLFALTAIFAMAYTAVEKPIQAGAGVLTMAIALALYFVARTAGK